ncbi:MAG: bifunctional diaminohydroxyphosphoribosylaminopyrimidine deaminase/5-amino-6-(5-phosphoribosylamino)uracil reductase RibD [Acidimicrobiales bacterium]
MDDRQAMELAIERAAAVRTLTSPNPWVGAVVLDQYGEPVGVGATEPPGGAHAEVLALGAAGSGARNGTLVSTLEPCSHQGRTPPCVEAAIAAGVSRVVVAVLDPDDKVAGTGVAALRAAGVTVDVGILADQVSRQLEPYLHHRRTGRPYVVCKLAATLDGATAAADGSSRWITGKAARTDVHRLRAESDAIVVGAGTVRADDPSLTVRRVEGADPLRVVLGRAPASARIHPCLEWSGDLGSLLDELGRRGVLQAMVEGGSTVVRALHDQDLVDRYVVYLAPALIGGRDMVPLLSGPSAPSIDSVWRGRFVAMTPLGDDVRLDLVPADRCT